MRRAKSTLKRQKSMSSQAESISAWIAVFDCPSMVAPLSVERHGPASRSAALSRIAARSSKENARHAGAAAVAASTAARASSCVAPRIVPSTWCRLCGWTTSISSPPPKRFSPPMVMVSSRGSLAIRFRVCSRSARSVLPGAYCRTGSLTGAGTWVTASMGVMVPPSGLDFHEDGELLGGVPPELVVLHRIDGEDRVVVAGLGRRQGSDRRAYVVSGGRVVDEGGLHLTQRDGRRQGHRRPL